MYTQIEIDNTIHSFVTQQYNVGTYIIVDNNPALQSCINKNELNFHIDLRKTALKHKDILVNGTHLDYNGKLLINKFSNE